MPGAGADAVSTTATAATVAACVGPVAAQELVELVGRDLNTFISRWRAGSSRTTLGRRAAVLSCASAVLVPSNDSSQPRQLAWPSPRHPSLGRRSSCARRHLGLLGEQHDRGLLE